MLVLKALFPGAQWARRYAREALNLLPDSPDPLLIDQILDAMPLLGAIHSAPAFALNPCLRAGVLALNAFWFCQT